MSNPVRTLPTVDTRVETGPTQFGDDWPGVFIRGDDAGYYAMALKEALTNGDDGFAKVILTGLYNTLRGCIITPAKDMLPEISIEGRPRQGGGLE